MSDLKTKIAAANFIADTVVFPVALNRLAEYGIAPVNEKQASLLRQWVATALANPEILTPRLEKAASATDEKALRNLIVQNMQKIAGLKEAALEICEFWVDLADFPVEKPAISKKAEFEDPNALLEAVVEKAKTSSRFLRKLEKLYSRYAS